MASIDIASSRHVSGPCEHGLVPEEEGFKSSLKRKEPYAGTALSCRTVALTMAACLSKTHWFSVFVATWPHDRGRGGPTSAAPSRSSTQLPRHELQGTPHKLVNGPTGNRTINLVPSNWQKVSVMILSETCGGVVIYRSRSISVHDPPSDRSDACLVSDSSAVVTS